MIYDSLHSMSRRAKRRVFYITDILLVPLCLYAAGALRYGTWRSQLVLEQGWVLFPLMVVVAAAVVHVARLPWVKPVSFETRALRRIAAVAGALAVAAIVLSYVFQLSAPRSVPLIFGALFFLAAVGTRMAALAILGALGTAAGRFERVAIYGAGAAGIQLASALRQSREAQPVFFVDDNPTLHGLMVAGLPVYGARQLAQRVERHRIKRVLLAIPSLSDARQKALLDELKALDVEVQVLPSYIDMMSGKGLVSALKPVTPDTLLGRDKVALDIPEIAKAYAGRVVMVTGAGGSIGSELCRQLVNCGPARIVLFEQGEFALYSIDQDLRANAAAAGIAVTTRLGSVTNPARVEAVMREDQVEIVLHAAAYKHVPLVEENELEGARNNVLGTQIVAEACASAGVERFILVSTDKAACPTNVMGATKRMAELVVQDLQTRSERTKFAMVRFGSALGSSGSVLPLFQKQIAAGGPLTVTHPEVTRFFMTIPEAARLVLLAGAYAEGGDVFVLDKGKPQKIIDIAHQLIELSGHTVKDPITGEGDVHIEITGLRPGEKLYEESLIDYDSLRPTPHQKIMRAEEGMLSQIELASMVRDLRACIEGADTDRMRRLIEARFEGYYKQELETRNG